MSALTLAADRWQMRHERPQLILAEHALTTTRFASSARRRTFFASLRSLRWSDRIGRRWVYAIGALGTGIWVFAFFHLLDSKVPSAVVVVIVVGLLLHGAMYGPQAAFLSEMFPTRIRYSGVSAAYQLTSIVAGSLAPIIAIALLQSPGLQRDTT